MSREKAVGWAGGMRLAPHTCQELWFKKKEVGKAGQNRQKKQIKKACPPRLIVRTGWITAGLRKKEEVSLPSDLKISPQGSEHVLWTRKHPLILHRLKANISPPGTEDNPLSSFRSATVIIRFVGQSEPPCLNQPVQVRRLAIRGARDQKHWLESPEKSPRVRHTKTLRWPIT